MNLVQTFQDFISRNFHLQKVNGYIIMLDWHIKKYHSFPSILYYKSPTFSSSWLLFPLLSRSILVFLLHSQLLLQALSVLRKTFSVNVRGPPVLIFFFSIVTGRNNMILERIHEKENYLPRWKIRSDCCGHHDLKLKVIFISSLK